MNTEKCEVCEDRGWLLSYNTSRDVYEIQKCDDCGKYKSDADAGVVAEDFISTALIAAERA